MLLGHHDITLHYFPFMAICLEEVCYQWGISHILQNLCFQNLSPVALRQAHSVVKEIPPAKIQFYGSLSYQNISPVSLHSISS